MAQPPTVITVELDDDGLFTLMADDGRMSPMPVGPRMFKAPPHPEVTFSHATMAAAETDARKVRVYLEWLRTKKK